MKPFPDCGEMPLGIYPLVDSADKLRALFESGITTAQLRIKDFSADALQSEIRQAIALAKQFDARLFINDAWQEAIVLGAYGVHLGQEDCEALTETDWAQLKTSGLRLGISTHTQDEMALALSVRPSYIAIGPVFETQSKVLAYETTGLSHLKEWVTGLRQQGESIPIVAIGGIEEANLAKVIEAGAQGVAMIGAVHISGVDSRIDIGKVKRLVTLFETTRQGIAHG